MPVPPQYVTPGVYVNEIPAGPPPIAGVATSVTAFVGRARRGTVDEPVPVRSFAEFQSLFGGLWLDSVLGYAVRDFFDNGGRDALIVRVSGDDATPAQLALPGPAGELLLQAASPGAWGNALSVSVSRIGDGARRAEVGAQLGLSAGQADALFDLHIEDGGTGQSEAFANLLIEPTSSRYIGTLLATSRLLSLVSAATQPPLETTAPAGVSVSGSDGSAPTAADVLGDASSKTGMHALSTADIFNLLCIPPFGAGDVEPAVLSAAAAFCEQRRAILLIDPPAAWDVADAGDHRSRLGVGSANAALYFPHVRKADPLQAGAIRSFPPSPAVAGIIARTDAARGVWKAPAGVEANLVGVAGLDHAIDDTANGELNAVGVNCLREFAGRGRLVWGARTLASSVQPASEWKYLSVRRTALFIEESVRRGTGWAVFEPNDEALWAALTLSVGNFLDGLFRQGALQGATTRDAYFVRCDRTTTTAADIAQGLVHIQIGFAPLRPAEFIVLKITQRTAL